MEILAYFGIPSAIFSAVLGFCMWWLKRDLNKREAARDEREKNTEQLMLLILKNARATTVLATATAKAVQRIPDAHCNGDMDTALEEAAEIQSKEQAFMFDQGIKRIFGE